MSLLSPRIFIHWNGCVFRNEKKIQKKILQKFIIFSKQTNKRTNERTNSKKKKKKKKKKKRKEMPPTTRRTPPLRGGGGGGGGKGERKGGRSTRSARKGGGEKRGTSSSPSKNASEDEEDIEKTRTREIQRFVKSYQNALKRHEHQAEIFAREIEQFLSPSNASFAEEEKEKGKRGGQKSERDEEDVVNAIVSPRSRKLLNVGRGQREQHTKKYEVASPEEDDANEDDDDDDEEDGNEKNRRRRNGTTSASTSLSLLGLADFTYFTRSVLLIATAKFYNLGGDSTLTATTTTTTNSSSTKDYESIFAVASAHALFVLVSDVLAQKRYIENALDAIVSVALRVFALLLGTMAWFCIAILFASSVIASSEKQRATLAFAFFMSSLTVLPGTHAASAQALVRTRNTRKQQNRRSSATSTTVEAIFMPALRAIAFVKLTQRNYLRVVVERRFRSDFDAFFRATVIGSVLFAWAGGLLAPLDWSTEWHKYPTFSVRLAMIGHIVGTALTAAFAWLDRNLPEKMKER